MYSPIVTQRPSIHQGDDVGTLGTGLKPVSLGAGCQLRQVSRLEELAAEPHVFDALKIDKARRNRQTLNSVAKAMDVFCRHHKYDLFGGKRN